MRKAMRKIFGLFMAVALVLGTMSSVFANTTMTKDGIEATITTDKESYEKGESIKVTVTVKNTGNQNVNNITVELKIPEGIQLAEGTDTTIAIGTLAAGEDKTEIIEAKAVTDVNPGEGGGTGTGEGGGTGTGTGEGTGTGTGTNNGTDSIISGNVETGDISVIGYIIVALAAVAVIVLMMIKRKNYKATGIISTVALTIIGVTAMIQLTYAGIIVGSFEISKTVKVDGADKTIVAVIKYGEKVADVEVSDSYDRASVHDPSIIKDPATGTYYVFGSHMAWAKSDDLVNWTTFTNNINTDYATLFAKEAKWSARGSESYDLRGNLWAPDVIWNTALNKWCMYMSVNGDHWYTSIVLLTADSLEGNWEYKGPVVYSGFTNATEAADTDLEKVIGTNDVPARYLQNRNGNRTYGMNAIDPCVFYDDNGTLWMSYGSWFGGIYMLKLDGATGLRDYQRTYETVEYESDAYQGLMIAGGNHVSGEASYIQKIGDYYYLFMSYGGLTANGGYNMRVFRSEEASGPYTDPSGDDARYMTDNTGVGSINGTVGVKLMTNYKWSYMKYGQVAQGHNSAFVDVDGKSYVVYHTRTNDGTEGHQVRVHQLFANEDGWLVAAPYEYTGEAISETGYSADDMAGTYEVLLQKQSINYATLECVTPQKLTLNSDGTVSGDYTGTWTVNADSSYVTMNLGNTEYKGVFVKQYMEDTKYETMCFTVLGNNEVEMWGSKYLTGKDAVDLTISTGTVTVPLQTVGDIDFITEGLQGTTISYTSSNTNVMTNEGVITRGASNTDVTVTATYQNGDYTYSKDYTITVIGESQNGEPLLVGEYYTNSPVNLSNAVEGTYSVPNPFNKSTTAGLEIYNGVSIEFDVEGTGTYLSSILSFYGGGRMYFTGGSYLGYNATGGFFDANVKNGASWAAGTDYINGDATIKIEIDGAGFKVYSNGQLAYTSSDLALGLISGSSTVTSYSNILSWLNNTAETLNFGWGSWWSDKFNGTISNVKLYANAIEEVDTSDYAYYQDYSSGDKSEWTSANAGGSLTVVNDGDAYGNYVKFAPGAVNSRGAIAKFAFDESISGNYTIQLDAKLTAGSGNNCQETQFAITGSDFAYTGNNMNNGLETGYILKLSTTNSTVWNISGTSGDTVTIPSGTWVTVKAEVNSSNGTAAVEILNGATSLYSGTVTISGTGLLNGIYVKGGRYNSVTCVDNVKVKVDEAGGDTPVPAEPTTATAEVTGTAYPDSDSNVTVVFTADQNLSGSQTVKINGSTVSANSVLGMAKVNSITYSGNKCTVSLTMSAISRWHSLTGSYDVALYNGETSLAVKNVSYSLEMSSDTAYNAIATAANEYSSAYYKVVGTKMYVMTIIKTNTIHCDGITAGGTKYSWWNGIVSELYMTLDGTKYSLGSHVYNALYSNPISWGTGVDISLITSAKVVRGYMAFGTFDNDEDTDKGCILLNVVDLSDIGLGVSDISGKTVTFAGYLGPNDGTGVWAAVSESPTYTLAE